MTDAQICGLVQFLKTIVEPALRDIPLEDEEISDEEEQAVAEAVESLKHNTPIAHEEVLAEFGLTMTDWERMGRTPLPEENNGVSS